MVTVNFWVLPAMAFHTGLALHSLHISTSFGTKLLDISYIFVLLLLKDPSTERQE
jgi:hypothetical protein